MPTAAIRKIYDAYFEKALAAEQNRKPTDGMFGIGKKAGDDPCHAAFAAELESALHEYASERPASDDVRTLLTYIYQIPKSHEDPKSMYWMLIAVHGLTNNLIPLLNAQDAADLVRTYQAEYKRWERLPVQQKILRALKQAAGNEQSR